MPYMQIVVLMFLTTPAYAYLDSGTVSILLQSLLGGLAIAMATLSLYWQKVRAFLFGKKSEEEVEEIKENTEEE